MTKTFSEIRYRTSYIHVTKLPHAVQWLSDNTLAYIAHETRDFFRGVALGVCTTPFYSPESNGWPKLPSKRLKEIMSVCMNYPMQ